LGVQQAGLFLALGAVAKEFQGEFLERGVKE